MKKKTIRCGLKKVTTRVGFLMNRKHLFEKGSQKIGNEDLVLGSRQEVLKKARTMLEFSRETSVAQAAAINVGTQIMIDARNQFPRNHQSFLKASIA